MEDKNLSNLSLTNRGSLEGIQSQTSSLWIYHKINSLLLPYGEGDVQYVEHVFLPSSQKNDKPNVQRPQKPHTSFMLFPNPAQHFTHLKWDWLAEGLGSELEIRLIDLQGQALYVSRVNDSKVNIKLIETNNLIPGIYLIEVRCNVRGILFNQKLVIVN